MSTPASPRPDCRPSQEFDLDVRLAPIAQRVSREEAQRATEVTCVQCTTKEMTCSGC